MKIKKQAIEVEFENVGEAARFLFGYTNMSEVPGQPAAAKEFGFHDSSTYEERRAAAAEAVRVLAAKYNVTLPAQAPDKEHAAPTYISGSSDRVYLISEMPTRYIRNVLNMDGVRQALGLRLAMETELRRRGERA